MNTNTFAKFYDRLTPWERLPLIMAASARGDEAERHRLVMSAPKMGYRVPGHFGVAMAFREVGEMHFMELLNLAALYFQSMGLADSLNGQKGERVFDTALLVGYLFKVQLAGWRQFCAEVGLEPELCWLYFPGFDTIKRAEQQAETGAFTTEGADACLRRSDREVPKVVTANAIAAGLRKSLKARTDWWG